MYRALKFILFSSILPFNIHASELQSFMTNNVNFSGFGRIVAGQVSTDEANYLGYDNQLSFSQQSLIAVQADVKLNSRLSVTAQVLGHTGDNRESGLEWLYATYRISPNWTFRAGRQRSPFYSYSDVLDVGFAYTWITPPTGIYNDYLFSRYDGVNLQYQSVWRDYLVSAEIFHGQFDDTLTITDIDYEPEIENFQGLIVKLVKDKWTYRASMVSGDVSLSIDELTGFSQQLRLAGFTQSADSLSIDGKVEFNQIGVKYDALNWFAEAEANLVKSQVLVVPRLKGIALTAGYIKNKTTFFTSFSKLDSNFNEPVNEIPIGISPTLDALSLGYQQVFQSLFVDDTRTFSLGVRYDVNAFLALKTAVTHIEGKSDYRSFFTEVRPGFNRRAQLYQASIEWVF